MNREKRHIKLVTYGNFPYGGPSANLLRNFSLSLSLENNDVEVLLPTGCYYGNKIGTWYKRKGEIEKVKYRHLGFINHPKNYFGKLLDNILGPINLFFVLLKQGITKKIDIIVAYNTAFSKTLLLLIIKVLINKKLVIILPEFYEKPKKNKFSLTSVKWYNFYLGLKHLVKYANGIITLSHFLKSFLINEVGYEKEILVQPNAIDPDIFNIDNIKPFKTSHVTIGYTGTPTRKDGVVDLIKSFSVLNKKYPKTHLLIIGDITNGNTILNDLKKLAGDLEVSDSITFTGLVPFSEIPKLLNSCQILTLTRPNGIFAEAGFPTKLGEYFACEKPVVVTKVGDIPFYFKDEEHVILVEPENIESIANGFEKLIVKRHLSNKLIKNAYQWMEINLNYRRISKRMDNFLISVIN